MSDSDFIERNMHDGKMSKKPKLQLAFAVLLSVGIAVFAFFRLQAIQTLEIEGGTMKMNIIESFIYDLGGAYAVLGAWLLIAIFILWQAYRAYKVKTQD